MYFFEMEFNVELRALVLEMSNFAVIFTFSTKYENFESPLFTSIKVPRANMEFFFNYYNLNTIIFMHVQMHT